MNKIKLNNNEKNLLKMLILLIFLLILNVFLIEPINLKITQLKMNKESIINIKNIEANMSNVESNIEEDIILKVQKELGMIVNIDYIDKKRIYDENDNDVTNIEIKVSGRLDQIFSIQEAINKLDLSKSIKYLEINNIDNIGTEDEENEKIVECIMQINVG